MRVLRRIWNTMVPPLVAGVGFAGAVVVLERMLARHEPNAGVTAPLPIVREYVEAINHDDRSRFIKALTGDVTAQAPGLGEPLRGPDDVADSAWRLRTSFPDLHGDIITAFTGDGHGVVEVKWTGTQEGPVGTPVGVVQFTGRQASWRALFLFELRDGKIAGITDYTDLATLMSQIGVPLPPNLTGQ